MSSLQLPLVAPATLKPLIIAELSPSLDITVVKDGASLQKLESFLAKHEEAGIDYETNFVDSIFARRARTLQIGDKNQQYVIDWMEWTGGSREKLYLSQGHFGSRSPYGSVDPACRAMIEPVTKVIAPVFDSRKYKKLGVNLEFEYLVSKWDFGFRLWNLYDCQQVEKVIFTGLMHFMATDFWGMDGMVARRLGIELDKTYQKMDWMVERPLTEDELAYCALDCRIPFVLRNLQQRDVTKGNLQWTVNIENDAIPAFGDIKIHGFKQDAAAWLGLMEENQRQLDATVSELDTFFVPVVGSKSDEPDPELVAKLEAEWRDLSAKSAEETELSAQIRKCPRSPEGVAQKTELVAKRTALEQTRKAQRDVNRGKYRECSKSFNKFHKDKEKWAGDARINYGSHAQLLKALVAGPFGLKALKSSADDALDKFADKPVIKVVRKFRKLEKRKGTYGEKWLRLDNEPEDPGYTDHYTGRLHSDVIQLGAATGRTSSREPNFQNLPKEKEFRACFISRGGYKLLTIDYNGCELRILAEYSQEKAWVEAFNKGWDVHSVCGEFLYGDKWRDGTVHEPYVLLDEKTGLPVLDKKTGEQVIVPKCAYAYKLTEIEPGVWEDHQKCECPKHKEYRGELKAVNFGIAYGKTAFGLAADLEISKEAAQDLLDKFAATFPILWAFLEQSGELGLKLMEARTMSQRRRAFLEITWEQAKEKATEWLKEGQKKKGIVEGHPLYRVEPYHGEVMRAWKAVEEGIKRQAKNTPIQGTNADMIKLAIGCGFDSNGVPFQWHRLEPDFGALLENIVHDEEVIEAPDSDDPTIWISPEYKGPGIKEGNAKEAFDWATDCMTRAGAEFVKSVVMVSEGHIDFIWRK